MRQMKRSGWRSKVGAVLSCVASLTLAGVFLTVGPPTASGNSAGIDGGSSGTASSGNFGVADPDEGDESIGSLPQVGKGPTPGSGGVTGSPPAPPLAEPMSVVLTGPADELKKLIAGSWGEGHMTWQLFDDAAGKAMAEISLHGNATLALDPAAADLDRIDLRVQLGLPFSGGLGVMSWNGSWSSPFPLPTLGEVQLPAGPVVSSGALQGGSAVLDLWGTARGVHGAVSLTDAGAVLLLAQDLP